jgi:hypothetical protein
MAVLIQGNPKTLNGRAVSAKVKAGFQLSDFVNADTLLKAKQWNPVGYYEVRADEGRMVGNGVGMMDTAMSRMYGELKDTLGAEIPGRMKFVYTNSFDQHDGESDEIEYTDLNTDAADITKQVPLNEQGDILTQDRRIWLWYYPDVPEDVTLDVSASTLRIPGTRYNLK